MMEEVFLLNLSNGITQGAIPSAPFLDSQFQVIDFFFDPPASFVHRPG